MSQSKILSVLFSLTLVACAAGNPESPDGGDSPGTDSGAPGADGGVDVPTDGAVPPRDGSTCVGADECTLDAQRCSGDDVQTCVIDETSGCSSWTDPAACGGALFCSGDVCTDTCAVDVCTDGERSCSSEAGFQVCELQASGCLGLSPEETCPTDETCMGAGVCLACTDGASRCGPLGEVQECVSGRWTLTEGCPFGCTAGACVESVECTAGAYRCRGNNVEACNSSGSAWLHISTCAVSCGGAGLCTGLCEAGATRCNGAGVETCNSAGTAWDATETCTTYCALGGCALDGLDISTNSELDGEVFIDGELRVRLNTILSSPTGNLTIHADSIVVDTGGSISVAATGETEAGNGADGYYYSYYGRYYGGGGGGYGGAGASGAAARGPAWGSNLDALVGQGSSGGDGLMSSSTVLADTGGLGGGVLRLIADSIVIDGQVTANGANGSGAGVSGGGGGSGGGVLLAADEITLGGSITARGGLGATVSGSYRSGTNGGNGRVKILYGGVLDETGTVEGSVTRGRLPPIEVASTTHPDPDLWYNDGFPVIGMSWARPFDPIQGYYWLHHTSERIPAPGTGTLSLGEIVSFPSEELASGANHFQIVSVTPTSEVGTVAGAFRIQLNRTPPTLSSTSHPSQTTWSMVPDVFMSWSLPQADENFEGVHYVFDHYGDTIPSTLDNFVPISQKQQLLAGIADGVWFFHVVSVDTQGYLNRTARHYQVRIGEDPGNGSVTGEVIDSSTSESITGATVSVNRGIVGNQSTSGGNFTFSSVPAGMWELRVRAEGYETATMMITVNADMPTLANMSLTPLPVTP